MGCPAGSADWGAKCARDVESLSLVHHLCHLSSPLCVSLHCSRLNWTAVQITCEEKDILTLYSTAKTSQMAWNRESVAYEGLKSTNESLELRAFSPGDVTGHLLQPNTAAGAEAVWCAAISYLYVSSVWFKGMLMTNPPSYLELNRASPQELCIIEVWNIHS